MNLETVSFIAPQGITTLADYAFSYDTVIEEVEFPEVTAVSTSCFENCLNLKKAIFFSATQCAGNKSFSGCRKLEELRLPKCTSALNSIMSATAAVSLRILDVKTTNWNYSFTSAGANLELVILRGDSVVTGTPVFHASSPIKMGTGRILVQPGLVNDYKTAWPDYASIIGAIGPND